MLNRIPATIGKLSLALVLGLGAFAAGCGHDDNDNNNRNRADRAGWRDRTSNNRNGSSYNQGYDAGYRQGQMSSGNPNYR